MRRGRVSWQEESRGKLPRAQGCGSSGFQQPLLATGIGSGVPPFATGILSALRSPRATGMGHVLRE